MNRRRVQAIQALQMVKAKAAFAGNVDPEIADARVDDPRKVASELNRWETEIAEGQQIAKIIQSGRSNQ